MGKADNGNGEPLQRIEPEDGMRYSPVASKDVIFYKAGEGKEPEDIVKKTAVDPA